jgi:hypothetical protein
VTCVQLPGSHGVDRRVPRPGSGHNNDLRRHPRGGRSKRNPTSEAHIQSKSLSCTEKSSLVQCLINSNPIQSNPIIQILSSSRVPTVSAACFSLLASPTEFDISRNRQRCSGTLSWTNCYIPPLARPNQVVFQYHMIQHPGP